MMQFAKRWTSRIVVAGCYMGGCTLLLDYVRETYGVVAALNAFAVQVAATYWTVLDA